jgi:hypothetical protein
MDTMAQWYDAANVKVLTHDANYPMDQTFSVKAHGSVEDTTADSVYHLVKISVFPGLDYYVEVRQEPTTVNASLLGSSDNMSDATNAAAYAKANAGQVLIDTHIFLFNTQSNSSRAGVLVTQVSTVAPEDTNQMHRLITKLGDDKLMVAGGETYYAYYSCVHLHSRPSHLVRVRIGSR